MGCVGFVFILYFCVHALMFLLDDPELYKGLPVGVQIVGSTLQEEVVLGIGEVIEAALKNH